MMKKDCNETNPLKVFENVYATIIDRKENPKEGSYTNYLFDKGIDKILKKVGEEATELVIAAKNPDPEEIKYIVENIQGIEMKRDNISSNYDGFSFSLSFKDTDGKTIDSFIVNSADTIRDDPFFYRCEGGLCFEYLKSLEE